MTIDPVELERLSKAAKELSYKLGPFKFNIRRQENYSGEHREWNEEFTLPVGALLTEQIVLEALRTGQLAPVQQPSGDVVEAVARAIMVTNGACFVKDWTTERRDNPHVALAWDQATAAITAYEAVSRVAKMRDALKKTMTALSEAIEEERARINSMRGAVLERTTNRDLAAIAEWQSAVDAARAALGEKP